MSLGPCFADIRELPCDQIDLSQVCDGRYANPWQCGESGNLAKYSYTPTPRANTSPINQENSSGKCELDRMGPPSATQELAVDMWT